MKQSLNSGLAAVAAVATVMSGSSGAVDKKPADHSAVLKQIEGRVFVVHDDTRKLGRKGMQLYAGTRVIASAKAKAGVVYPDGCTIALPENSLLVIGKPDQCSNGQAKAIDFVRFQDKAIGQITEAVVGSSWFQAAQTAIANQLIASGLIAAGPTAMATAMAAALGVMAAAGVTLAVGAVAGVVTVTEGAKSNDAQIQAYLSALASQRDNQGPIIVPTPEPTPTPLSS